MSESTGQRRQGPRSARVRWDAKPARMSDDERAELDEAAERVRLRLPGTVVLPTRHAPPEHVTQVLYLNPRDYSVCPADDVHVFIYPVNILHEGVPPYEERSWVKYASDARWIACTARECMALAADLNSWKRCGWCGDVDLGRLVSAIFPAIRGLLLVTSVCQACITDLEELDAEKAS